MLDQKMIIRVIIITIKQSNKITVQIWLISELMMSYHWFPREGQVFTGLH